MKNITLSLLAAFLVLLAPSARLSAQESADTIFFTLTDNSMMIFPHQYIEQWDEDDNYITLTLQGDTTVTIAKSHIAEQATTYTGAIPGFESFKFNNKFNDQLYTDAIGEIDDQQGTVQLTVACIGKRLTPSFQVPDGAKAYINGKRQYSKQTSQRFDQPVHYTVAYPDQYIYRIVKTKDEVWSYPGEDEEDKRWFSIWVPLTAEMLSTNAPSNNGEDLGNMIDGDPYTIYHSTWGTGMFKPLTWFEGAYYGDGTSEWPYIDINLPEPLEQFQFQYITRNQTNYAPLGFILYGSNDGGETWDEIRKFTAAEDKLPNTPAAIYLSPIINAGQTYGKLRLQLTAAQHKNYLVLSEFSLYKMEENPDYGQKQDSILVSPAEYQKGFFPYGKDYVVNVNHLTDQATTEYKVPRIDVWFGDRQTWSGSMWIGRYGKDYFEEASIRIDGAGVFPDMEETPIQIKGRGNSSWSWSAYSKNPYRIKFEEKMKPFGLTKGKNWVLLANKQTNSMTTNAIAMKIADMVETRGANHIVPVELYVNNQYRGSYNFTEKVGFSNNSIDLDDESKAVMLELDSYYDEPYKFRDATYNLYVNIKEPDLSAGNKDNPINYSVIQSAFNKFTSDVRKNGGTSLLDVDAFVRAMLVNDLVRNEELKHPKSWYLYNEDITADSLWQFGPVWDFDWAYGYEGSSIYFIRNAEVDLFANMSTYSDVGYNFFVKLLRGSDVVKKAYYRLWTEFMTTGKLEELIEFCDDYYEYANSSFQHNSWMWGDGSGYATINSNAKSWLTKRANYIYSHLDKYELDDDVIEMPEEEYGQPDRIDPTEVAAKLVDVYTVNGILVRRQVPYGQFNVGLTPGIYIVNGKKVVIR